MTTKEKVVHIYSLSGDVRPIPAGASVPAETVSKVQIELLQRVIKMSDTAMSRGSLRVALHNMICELDDERERKA